MPHDDGQSLGDEATLQGGKPSPADERSLGDRSTFGGSDGSSLSDLGEFADLPDHDMEIVDLSSRYKIERSLGKGGMGEVLLATDTRLDRKVAIKRIRGDAASSKAAVARFLTEAKSIAALSHNNVVQVYDYGRDQEGPFLIMEYVPGGSLLDRCKQGPIELEEAVELACQLCDGLGRAHDAGIIHRDIKPANILLTDDSVPKLTDFGLAKADSRDHTMTMAGAVLGTLDFMPPEQRQDASLVDARSDLWSLAATLYQMLTGESPEVIRLKNVPAQLQNLLDKALEESKDARYQAASELKEALQQSVHGGNVASVELEQGVCPSCGTKNEVGRKFCRNKSCATSLQVSCLSCAAMIPIWEDVCGECGSVQTDLLEQRREEMAAQKAEAESCLASHDYRRATELAIEIGNEAAPRLQQQKIWSAEFAEQVESTKRAQIENAKQAIAEALSHEKAYDYSSGIKAFAQIPDSILAGQDIPELEPARETLARLQKKQDQADTLEAEVKSRIKARNLSGLLPQVDCLLGLLPERTDLRKLQQQLQKRESDLKKAREKMLSAARASIQQHDYAGVLSMIAKLNPEQVDNELAELQSLARAREARTQKLSTQIRQAVNAEQYEGLLALIEEYLTLKPNDTDALKSRAELIAREQQRQAENAALLAKQREEAEKKRVAANELAAKQRARKLQIIVGSTIAAAFVLMVALMFYLRVRGIARDISEALDRGDYAVALELDPGNEQARIMQQNAADLATALRSIDYQRALQLDPSNAEALSMKKAEDIQRALSDGDYAAVLLLDPDNTQALELRSAALKQALAAADYVTVLEIDPSNAEALAMKKAADLRQALADGDYAAALRLDPANVEALAMKKVMDVQQALADGDYTRALRLDPANAEALAMKRSDAPPPPAVAPFDAARAREHQEAWAKQLGVEVETENSIGMRLCVIPPGTVTIGDREDARQVTLTKPFLIGSCEVTQTQYQSVQGNNPSYFKGPDNPVAKVSWDEAVEFCRKLTELPSEKSNGRVYQLPTEAQWEHACRAGTTTKYSFGDDVLEGDDYAWLRSNSSRSTHAVGSKKANSWGIFDMYGNVSEWCDDKRHRSSTNSAMTDYRVICGSNWDTYNHSMSRSSANRRSYRDSSTGFRVVCFKAED